jgi:hypothetical protein
MSKTLFLHIGTYKTGTTSLQRFVLDQSDELRRHGIALYRGQIRASNHIELHLAALRYDRDSFAKLGHSQHVKFDVAYTQQIARRVQSFLNSVPEPCALFSSEGLSLLRYDDEIERLRTILDAHNREVRVVLYLRNKADFLRSYASQILKQEGRKPSHDKRSALYVGSDTWLTDYDSLIAAYQRGFGAGNLTIIDYDAEMQRVGNVIPSFLKVLGVQAGDKMDPSSYFLNTTCGGAEKPRRRRLRNRAKAIWQNWFQRRAA